MAALDGGGDADWWYAGMAKGHVHRAPLTRFSVGGELPKAAIKRRDGTSGAWAIDKVPPALRAPRNPREMRLMATEMRLGTAPDTSRRLRAAGQIKVADVWPGSSARPAASLVHAQQPHALVHAQQPYALQGAAQSSPTPWHAPSTWCSSQGSRSFPAPPPPPPAPAHASRANRQPSAPAPKKLALQDDAGHASPDGWWFYEGEGNGSAVRAARDEDEMSVFSEV